MEENQNQENKEQSNIEIEETITISETITIKESTSKESGRTELDSISTLLKNTWALYEKRLWKLVGITVIPFIGIFLLGIISFFLKAFNFYIVGSILVVVVLCALIVISVWSKSSLLIAIRDSEEKIGIRESFKRSQKYIWHYFVISILLGFLIFGGMTLLLVPGIILGIMTVFSHFVLVNEEEKDINALAKSREYVRGYWWEIFGRIVLLLIVIFILSTIPVLGMIITFFFATPFAMVYIFMMYKNLKEIRNKEASVVQKKDTKNLLVLVVVIGIFMILFYIGFLAKLNNFDNGYKNDRKMYEKSSFGKYDKQMQMHKFKKDRF